ncbi:serine-rich adhesin for platelets-like [Watersipora subatra]|uniref:serine-rich adhesin for platelets-like n=1 Tax=Watersipora subatra TaxID=2589382 RepID=UPI00355BD134
MRDMGNCLLPMCKKGRSLGGSSVSTKEVKVDRPRRWSIALGSCINPSQQVQNGTEMRALRRSAPSVLSDMEEGAKAYPKVVELEAISSMEEGTKVSLQEYFGGYDNLLRPEQQLGNRPDSHTAVPVTLATPAETMNLSDGSEKSMLFVTKRLKTKISLQTAEYVTQTAPVKPHNEKHFEQKEPPEILISRDGPSFGNERTFSTTPKKFDRKFLYPLQSQLKVRKVRVKTSKTKVKGSKSATLSPTSVNEAEKLEKSQVKNVSTGCLKKGKNIQEERGSDIMSETATPVSFVASSTKKASLKKLSSPSSTRLTDHNMNSPSNRNLLMKQVASSSQPTLGNYSDVTGTAKDNPFPQFNDSLQQRNNLSSKNNNATPKTTTPASRITSLMEDTKMLKKAYLSKKNSLSAVKTGDFLKKTVSTASAQSSSCRKKIENLTIAKSADSNASKSDDGSLILSNFEDSLKECHSVITVVARTPSVCAAKKKKSDKKPAASKVTSADSLKKTTSNSRSPQSNSHFLRSTKSQNPLKESKTLLMSVNAKNSVGLAAAKTPNNHSLQKSSLTSSTTSGASCSATQLMKNSQFSLANELKQCECKESVGSVRSTKTPDYASSSSSTKSRFKNQCKRAPSKCKNSPMGKNNNAPLIPAFRSSPVIISSDLPQINIKSPSRKLIAESDNMFQSQFPKTEKQLENSCLSKASCGNSLASPTTPICLTSTNSVKTFLPDCTILQDVPPEPSPLPSAATKTIDFSSSFRSTSLPSDILCNSSGPESLLLTRGNLTQPFVDNQSEVCNQLQKSDVGNSVRSFQTLFVNDTQRNKCISVSGILSDRATAPSCQALEQKSESHYTPDETELHMGTYSGISTCFSNLTSPIKEVVNCKNTSAQNETKPEIMASVPSKPSTKETKEKGLQTSPALAYFKIPMLFSAESCSPVKVSKCLQTRSWTPFSVPLVNPLFDNIVSSSSMAFTCRSNFGTNLQPETSPSSFSNDCKTYSVPVSASLKLAEARSCDTIDAISSNIDCLVSPKFDDPLNTQDTDKKDIQMTQLSHHSPPSTYVVSSPLTTKVHKTQMGMQEKSLTSTVSGQTTNDCGTPLLSDKPTTKSKQCWKSLSSEIQKVPSPELSMSEDETLVIPLSIEQEVLSPELRSIKEQVKAFQKGEAIKTFPQNFKMAEPTINVEQKVTTPKQRSNNCSNRSVISTGEGSTKSTVAPSEFSCNSNSISPTIEPKTNNASESNSLEVSLSGSEFLFSGCISDTSSDSPYCPNTSRRDCNSEKAIPIYQPAGGPMYIRPPSQVK